MSSAILQTVPIGAQWPTIDPFLFCAHHLDLYPEGNGSMGPAASLDGRVLGQDFEGADGWRMYHGQEIAGFPQHPHRGFETVTYVRRGYIDHADSLGAVARFGRGDVQWLTAGKGIVHCEMFPLLDDGGPNTLELFQIWLNLPAGNKLVDPYFSMLWSEQIPRITETDDRGRTAEVTVIAGELDGITPPVPPPDSWARRRDSRVGIWHLHLDPGASWTFPAEAEGVVRTVYLFEGDDLELGGEPLGAASAAMIDATRPVPVTSVGGADVLVLQGRPIGEPVARYGPFVMNTEEEIQQAFVDYRATEFGGWPWPSDEPVNALDAGRFARHPDGTLDAPA